MIPFWCSEVYRGEVKIWEKKKQKIDVCFEFLAFLLVISLNLLCAISFESKNQVTWGSEAKTFQDTYTEWLDKCDETNNLSNMVDMPYWIYKTAFDKTEMVWGAFKDSRLSLVPSFVRYCKASILILSESYYRFRWEKSRFYEFDLLEFIYSHSMWILPSILCLNQTFFTFDTAFVLK